MNTQEFLEAVRQVSYYRAGEGEMWRREQREARQAEERLKSLWTDMVAAHGEDETRRLANSIPNLLFLELQGEGEGGKA